MGMVGMSSQKQFLCEDCIKKHQLVRPFGYAHKHDRDFCDECSYLTRVWAVTGEKIIENFSYNGTEYRNRNYNGIPCNDYYGA